MKNMHDNEWENRQLGADEAFVKKSKPSDEKALDDQLGLQAISIRLQKNLIDELKELAIENGLGYQPYMRQILTQHVRNEKRKRAKYIHIMKK